MKRWALLPALALLLIPSVARAQARNEDKGLLLRVNGDVRIGADELTGTVVVIKGDALVQGRVRHTLVLINGDAMVSGTVEGDLTVIRGTLDLRPGARVGGDVTLVNSTLNQAPGATVAGSIERRSNLRFGWVGWGVRLYLWLGFTLIVLVAGLAYAAIAGRQLAGAGDLITARLGPTLLATVILWIGLPVLAVLAFLTVVGIPLGIGLLLFLLPALWFLGYLVSGTRLGTWLLGLMGRAQPAGHPYLPALLGLAALQVVQIVPGFGPLAVAAAGLLGAGALAFWAWCAWRGAGTPRPAPAQ